MPNGACQPCWRPVVIALLVRLILRCMVFRYFGDEVPRGSVSVKKFSDKRKNFVDQVASKVASTTSATRSPEERSMNPGWLTSAVVRHTASTILLVFVGLALPGCDADVKGTAPGAQSDASRPVAEVNGKPIPMSQLEEMLAPQLGLLERQRRQLLENGVQALVDHKLLEAEAAALAISVDELYKAEIEDERTRKGSEPNKAG